MNTAVWALVIGVLALTANMVNGYLQRKQMRQNELYRQDPSVGLIPPPHPLRTHLWTNRSLYLNFGFSAISLVVGFLPGPFTRLSVLNISTGVCLFYLAFISHGQDRLLAIMEKMNKMIGVMADTQGLTIEAIRKQATLQESEGP
jgi:hypothetical protein